jgi:hypothetical protein
MSTEETATSAVGATPAPPDDQQSLQEEIERTREHLGETVDALAAKADVKSRAQEKASQLTGWLKSKAAQADVKAPAQEKARQLSGLLKNTAAQGRHRAATAATSISKAAPEPVKGAADNAASATRRHRVPLAGAVGAIGAGVLAWLLIRRWRGR